ncbi:MAG: hypothetical protein HUU01_22840 [Saprospiraceae bacterium]|nr:hypothetical protein [Saprospiraceae bacterium]
MNNKLQKLSLIALFAALFSYVLIRASGLSFTHDESLSYTIIKGSPLWATSPNNHTLNTWLMGICSTLFGDRELSLRLPNVLAFLVFSTFVFLLLKGAKSSLFALLGAILMVVNPFLLDFFSIARGYGLSLGFMAASLYFFLRRDLSEHTGNSFLLDFTVAMFFAFLVLLSNLSAINFYLALLAVFAVQYPLWAFLYRKGKTWQHLAFAGILALASWSLKGSLTTLLQLSRENQLYFGEKKLVGSLDSLINCSFYFSTYPDGVNTIVKYAVIGLLATAVVTAAFQKFLHRRLQKVLSLILLITAGFVAEHHLFGANYPAERTALIFIPLFGLAWYEMAAIWRQKLRPSLQPVSDWGLLALLALPLVYHFASNANLQYTHTWQYDAHTKDAMEVVARANSAIGDGTETISISNSALFEPAINYYREINKLTKVQPATRDPLNIHATFIYEFEANELVPKDLERVAEFRDIKTVLFRGKAAVANIETENLPK